MTRIVRVMGLSVLLAAGGGANAQIVAGPTASSVSVSAASLDPKTPVTAGDISDRPYMVVGEVKAGVRKATVFSGASSEGKIYRELWERARKMGADAVIHASYGKSHVSAMSWGKTNATGTAIRFNDTPAR